MLLGDDRIQLMPLSESFVDFITEIRTDWTNYEFFFDFHLATREQELAWISRVTRDPTQANFVIVSRANPGEALGTISLTDIDMRSRRAEYGRLFISAGHRGIGAARRASRLLLDYAFRELNLRRVYLRVFSTNERAIRLYRELGFNEEGCLRGHVYKNGTYEDVMLMALLAPQTSSNSVERG